MASDFVAELSKLAELYNTGVLSYVEFEAAKQRLLDRYSRASDPSESSRQASQPGSGPDYGAGWYPNPDGAGARYWNGTEWTDRARAGALPPPVPPGIGHAASPASPGNRLTPSQLQILGRYDSHKESLCLECGYEGRMGVASIGRSKSWFYRWQGVLLMFFLALFVIPLHPVVSILVFFAYGSAVANARVATLHCPGCDQLIQEKK